MFTSRVHVYIRFTIQHLIENNISMLLRCTCFVINYKDVVLIDIHMPVVCFFVISIGLE